MIALPFVRGTIFMFNPWKKTAKSGILPLDDVLLKIKVAFEPLGPWETVRLWPGLKGLPLV